MYGSEKVKISARVKYIGVVFDYKLNLHGLIVNRPITPSTESVNY